MVVTQDFHSNLSWSLLCCLCVSLWPVWRNHYLFGQDFEHNLCISRAVMKRQGPGISPQQLSKENRRNIEPKETHSYLIPHLLVVFTQQHEILLTTRPMCHCSTSKQMKTITREAPGLGEVVRYELNKVYSFIHLFILFIIIYPF